MARQQRRSRHRRHKRACRNRGWRRRLGLPEVGKLSTIDIITADWRRVDSTRVSGSELLGCIFRENPAFRDIQWVGLSADENCRYAPATSLPVWGGSK